jgi:hypothetical protein
MASSPKTCPKCSGGRMTQGFVLDLGDGNAKKVANWIEGPVEKGWFGVAKTRDRRRLEIESYRCERCGYLESYAPTA